MNAVYILTLRQLTGKWRLLVMLVLSTLPVFVTAVMLDNTDGPSVNDFEQVVLGGILMGAVTPLIVLSLAGAAFANELEDRTLANLTLSPLARWEIVLPKLLASITIAAPLIVVSAAITANMAFLGDIRATLAVGVSALVAVALYSAAFLWLGLVTTQAIGLGLLYIVLWEGFFSGFVAGVRSLSLRHHALGVMHSIDGRRFAQLDHLGAIIGTVIVALVFAGFALLAIRRLRRMDVP
jgi:ABC-2 type transport system permease protein